MSNNNLFDDLDLDGLVVPNGPKKEEKKEEEIKPASKKEISEAAKDVVKEIKPAMISSLEDIFDMPQDEEVESELDDLDYLRTITKEKLKTEDKVVIDGIEVYLVQNDEEEDLEEDTYSVYVKTPIKPKGEKALPESYGYEDALDAATSHILKLTEKPKKKTSSKKKPASAPAPKKEQEPPYEGPRKIKVWGRELWVEQDPKVTEKEIIEKIARDFGFPEFRDNNVVTSLDKESGTLSVSLSFNKKG